MLAKAGIPCAKIKKMDSHFRGNDNYIIITLYTVCTQLKKIGKILNSTMGQINSNFLDSDTLFSVIIS
jgi:hypothetical protein